jgi:hypothetical protein
MKRFPLTLLRAFVFAAFTAPAFGVTPAEEADRLFKEAVALRDKDDIAGACRKFDESQKAESSSGTLLNIGQCHETFGRFASAQATYLKAKELAATRGKQDHIKKADERLKAIDSKVAHLSIDQGPLDGIPGASIELDGVVTTARDVAIDPGPHVVETKAPNYDSGVYRVNVDQSAAQTTVVVPRPTPRGRGVSLVEEKKAGPQLEPSKTESPSRVPAYLLGAAGLAGIALGSVSGLIASSALEDAKGPCPTYPKCSPEANEPNDRATIWATVSTVSFIAGGALLAAGAVYFFVAKPKTQVSVSPSTNGVSVSLTRSF